MTGRFLIVFVSIFRPDSWNGSPFRSSLFKFYYQGFFIGRKKRFCQGYCLKTKKMMACLFTFRPEVVYDRIIDNIEVEVMAKLEEVRAWKHPLLKFGPGRFWTPAAILLLRLMFFWNVVPGAGRRFLPGLRPVFMKPWSYGMETNPAMAPRGFSKPLSM